MRDLIFLRNNTKAVLRQLYPTGRAWQGEGDSELVRKVKSGSLANYLYELEDFVANILPDNDLFTERDAINWERRLELDYDPDTLNLDERKAEIIRKLSFPGGYKNTLTLQFLEYQLRASSFDVRVYRNDALSQPADTELIANSIDKEEGFTINNFYHTFIIAGETVNTQAVIESRRRNEFIRKVLRYKPMNMVCFLNSSISKQDGTFKLKYSDYICQLIEETAPYATNVTVSGIKEVGKTLEGSYTYNDDEGDPESGTTFKWYRSDDDTGTNKTEIAGATSQSYTLTSDDANKYIQFAVIPANVKATGSEELSGYYGSITPQNIPVITSFADWNSNTLYWSMNDDSEDFGTWTVEYSLNNSNWKPTTSGGSPRVNVLPEGTYNQDVYFRVKRISEPVTEYSEIFTSYVEEIIQLYDSLLSQVVDFSETMPPSGICDVYNKYTSRVYIDTPEPVVGSKIYFENDGNFYVATKSNINEQNPADLSHIDNGIGWVRFVNIDDTIWQVDPSTGGLLIDSSWTCPI